MTAMKPAGDGVTGRARSATGGHRRLRIAGEAAVVTVALAALWAASLSSYLLFHTIVEVLFIAMAFAVLAMAWSLRGLVANGYAVTVGIGLVCASAIQLFHTLAYEGMGVFAGFGSPVATQLWIASRYLTVAAFLTAPFFVDRRPPVRALWAVFAGGAVLLLASILWWHVFPTCYVQGVGLTTFKKISEYVIAALFVLAAVLVARRGSELGRAGQRMAAAAMLISAASELAFTLYVGVYAFFNLAGHLLMFLAVYLVYRGVVISGLGGAYTTIVQDADQALRAGQERFRRIVDTSPVGIVILDTEGAITFANHLAEETLGLSADEMSGRTYDEPTWKMTALDGGPFPSSELPFARVMASGRVVRGVEHAIEHPDGRRVALSINAAPLHDAAGRLTGVVATIEDITERKRTEHALRRLNRELRAISDCNQVLMRAADEQALLDDICAIICDEAGYRMAWVGYAEHDEAKTVRPMAWAGVEEEYLASSVITWADTQRGRGPSGTTIRSGESACIQDLATDPLAAPWRESALRRGYRSSIALPLKDEAATTFGALNIYATEPDAFTPDEIRLLEELAGDLAYGISALRTRAERGRAEQKANQLAAIVESSEDAIIGKTLDGIVTSWNEGAEKVYGYSEGEMIGKPVSVLVPPGHEDEVPRILEKIASGEHVEHLETVRRTKDGEPIHVSLTVSPIRDPNGSVVAASTIARDISEQKCAEEKIRTLNRELEARVRERTTQLETANAELEAFAYTASHDLRAPLRHIDGFVALLQERLASVPDEESQHFMAAISKAARTMDQLIDDLLSFSRMGRQRMSAMPVDLASLVRDVKGSLEEETKGRHIDWRIAELPVVNGDQAMLRVVLVNLIANAVKFTRPRERAEIEIGCTPGEGEETVVFVRDNGVGFDMRYADQLFGVFSRLHRADEFEGTGIGLASVRRIIERHGGRVWAEGVLDGGATFSFSLPARNVTASLPAVLLGADDPPAPGGELL